MGHHLPGREAYRDVEPREILTQAGADKYIQVPVVLSGDDSYDGGHTGYEKYIRGGSILAYSSADGVFAPLKLTLANGGETSETALVVDDASFFKAGDEIVIAATSAVEIASIVYSTNTITLAAARTWSDDALVRVTKYAVPRGILLDSETILWNRDKTANVNKSAQMLIAGGPVNMDMVLGDLDAALAADTQYLQHVVFDQIHRGLAG